MRACDLGIEDPQAERLFPGFLRCAESRRDIVGADGLAITLGPLLVGWKLAGPNQRTNQAVGCQLVSVFPALIPIVQMTDEDERPVRIAVEQLLDVPAGFPVATFGQIHIGD